MNKLIRFLLLNHLDELDSKFKILYEGVVNSLNLPCQTVYLQPTSTTTSTIGTSAKATDKGYLQVTLHCENNKGTSLLDEQADRIRRHFYQATLIDKNQNLQIIIDNPPLTGGIFFVDGHLAMPITINYTAYEL
ncbi:phage tail terminator-like protein [Phocoenobacter skyensis]|uniref:Uncharacterized protein n=1 Tax=Phocoenobacter skyensis TaxID=97481 RepID=A0A1H8A1T2_9PAST|nr:phage tail terminator-like protein [Pasteurella skyensis]MDP8184407.1 phage tail terminator-like protein [Pasteurella skyensis]QLB22591.1 hypothetical protein A6B44_04975 [Pasteurella skyensis]SEM63507.1 Bacteriophage related protein of unknown function [Pasteurella skyensis]